MEPKSIKGFLAIVENDRLRPEDKSIGQRTPQEQKQVEMDMARDFLRKEFAERLRELK